MPSTMQLMPTQFKEIMKTKPIKFLEDYERALERLDVIFDAAPDTEECKIDYQLVK